MTNELIGSLLARKLKQFHRRVCVRQLVKNEFELADKEHTWIDTNPIAFPLLCKTITYTHNSCSKQTIKLILKLN